MTRTLSLMVLACFLLAGCSGGGDEDDGTTSPTSTPTSTPGSSVATAVEILESPAASPAGSKATVCWTVSGSGTVPHTAIHWDDMSHASETPRTFQLYNLGASYPNNQSSPASSGYTVQATGTTFCTAATMPASGSIFVVAHVMDSTGAPGRISTEREIRVGSASDAHVVIQNSAYAPPTFTVSPGAIVSVENKDTIAHTLTSDGSTAFDTGNIPAMGSDSFEAPITPGTYAFKCAYHDSMRGTLTVA